MAELCFNRCVHSLGQRNLSADEEFCVDKCASKHVNINHKMMSIYMEVQPQIVNKRNEELQQQAQQQLLAAATVATPVPETDLPAIEVQSPSTLTEATAS